MHKSAVVLLGGTDDGDTKREDEESIDVEILYGENGEKYI